MNPVLSVCIPNYQGEAVIARCLDSVLSQECDFPFEVIVHDDASTDSSLQILESGYPGITLIRSDINRGFCESSNRMADEARGEFLLLLNNDTRLHPGSLQALMNEALASPDAGILSLPQYDMATGELLDRGMFLDLFVNPIPVLEPESEVAFVMGSCLWIRSELWREVGGFPSWFGSLAEDAYLCSRVRLLGLKVRVIETGAYDHVVGHSFGGGKLESNRLATSFTRRRLTELNKNRVIATCFPGFVAPPLLCLQLILLLLEGCAISLLKLSLRPLLEIYLPSVSGILGDLPRLMRERSCAMSDRRISSSEFYSTIRLRHHKLALLWRHGIPRIS